MPFWRARVSAALVLLGVACAAFAQSPASAGSVGGRLVDESGGALPGVTVSIACAASGGVIATVTDGEGSYLVPGLSGGSCSVAFELSGFEKLVREGVQVANGSTVTVSGRLGLAKLAETVTVVGQAPPERKIEVPKPRPRVLAQPVPPHDVDSVCGPGRQSGPPGPAFRLMGNRDDAERMLLAAGDAIMIDGGWVDGLAVGQSFVVRRLFHLRDLEWIAPTARTAVHTAGLVQIIEVAETYSTAAVVYACGAFFVGDELEAFAPEPIRPQRSTGEPDFDRPARVLFGDEGKTIGEPDRLMVIDQGANDGLEAGQRVTLFRRSRPGAWGISRLGEAVVVAVRADWSRIRIDSVHDVVFAGDQAAPQRQPGATRKTASRGAGSR
jgi:hypothetical protein